MLFAATEDMDLEKVLISPLSHSLGVSRAPRGPQAIRLHKHGTPGIARVRRLVFCSGDSEPLSAESRQHTHNAAVPSLLRDGITLTAAQTLELQRPGSESQHTCPTNATLSFSFLTRKKGIIISIPRLLGNDRLHVNHQAHRVTTVDEGFEGFSPSRGKCPFIHF